MFKEFIQKIIFKFAGKKKHQKLFENLYHLSLKGMNIGGGAGTSATGEELTIQYVDRQLSEIANPVVFDVGANIGKYISLLKKGFGQKAIIHAFEPAKITFHKLISNFPDAQNIKFYNFAFGNENSRLRLFSDKDASTLASLYKRRLDHFNIEMDRSEEIEIKTIDGFCAEKNIDHIHFLKLDVEGYELIVLQGAEAMLKSGKIDFIQFEFGGCNIDSRTYFQDFYYLLKDDFHLYRILKDGLHLIEKYKESQEAFLTTNYLAERKNP